jgi:hypothetical protein
MAATLLGARDLLDALTDALARAAGGPVVAAGGPAAGETVQLRVDVTCGAVAGEEDTHEQTVWVAAPKVLVLGLRARTYGAGAGWAANRGRVYVQYVDSTRFLVLPWARGHLARTVVGAYVRAVAQVGWAVHVFARHQPAFLFPGSVQDRTHLAVPTSPHSDVRCLSGRAPGSGHPLRRRAGGGKGGRGAGASWSGGGRGCWRGSQTPVGMCCCTIPILGSRLRTRRCTRFLSRVSL